MSSHSDISKQNISATGPPDAAVRSATRECVVAAGTSRANLVKQGWVYVQRGGQIAIDAWNRLKCWLDSELVPSSEVSVKKPYKLNAIQLEDRILYSASPLLAVLGEGESPEVESLNSNDISLALDELVASLISATSEELQPEGDLGISTTNPLEHPLGSQTATEPATLSREDDAAIDALATTQVEHKTYNSGMEVVFVQSGLLDSDQLLADLEENALATDRQLVIVVLSGSENGFDQVDSVLSQYSNLDAIHFVSHGSDGTIQLGGSWLTAGNIDLHSEQLRSWGMSLSESGDILIYGCDVAAGPEGQAFIDTVAALTGADVAASTNKTGDLSRGGDWSLEYVSSSSIVEQLSSTVHEQSNSQTVEDNRSTVMQTVEDNRSTFSQTVEDNRSTIETRIAFGLDLQVSYGGLLATYTVTNTNDSGAGSLRQAITDANNNAGTDTIAFSVGSGVISINLTSGLLPTINGTVIIDGWSQPGFTSTPIVVIDGGSLIAAGDGLLLSSSADNSTIRGLVIRDFNGDGIQIDSGADGNTIVGNYIGSFASSGGSLGSGEANTGNGINVLGTNNTIGGTTAQSRNVIGGNLTNGILLTGTGANNNIIQGNYIGTDATGIGNVGNSGDGIRIASSSNANTIGGTTTSHRNVIVANGSDGIEITGSNSHNNVIRNNFIGLGADGITVLGNAFDGILIDNGPDNTIIGGINMGNVILGNRGNAIEIDGTSTLTIVQGNFIGINLAGTIVQGAGLSGVLVEGGATSTTIGGTTTGEGNIITNSGFLSATNNAGIQVLGGSASGTTITGNSIYENRGIGIDLGTTGVTANDLGDADTGPNGLQNFPVLTAASVNAAGTSLTVSGSINSMANVTGMLLHFYATPSSGNVNARQGRRYLGSTTVNTDASGNQTFTNINLTGYTGTVAAGELITATATTPGGNGSTSEFSQGFVANSSLGNSAPSTSQLVGTEQGGLTINTNGYSTWLEATDGGALLGGRTQLSFEAQFRAQPMAGDAFYAIASYTTPSDGDQLFIGAGKAGASEFLYLMINNQLVTINTDVDAIFDGNQHSLAFTWNQTGGAYAIYLDGVVLGSGTGLATGHTFLSGGQFGIGVDLDSGTDTWQPGALFQGTFNDVRIFSDVRTATEIASSYRSDLPYNEGNLVANWRFEDLSTEGRTTNTVSNNALQVRTLTNSWSVTDAYGLQLRIDENLSTGSVVGQVIGSDVEREQRISSLLSADSSLRYSAETRKFYMLVTGSSMNWSTAQTSAIAQTLNGVAGQLATIHSAGEQAFIASMNTSSAFLGGSDSLVEGEWRWYDGTTPSSTFWRGTSSGYAVDDAYTYFDAGDPDDFSGNQDSLIITSTGEWDDINSSQTRYWVQWNADDVLDATNTLTFTITSQTIAGAFAINSDSGVITVANGSLLNFEVQTSHTITVRTTDGSGAFVDRNYSIALNNLTEENNAPSDLSSGINLNTDGGNNAYLMTSSGGSVFGGRTQFTVETTFSGLVAGTNHTLISYFAGSDQVELHVMSDNTLYIEITGIGVTTANAYSQLTNGSIHSVAISWDNTAGDLVLYLDGQRVESWTGRATGATIAGGGTLAIGNEQDSLGGNFTTLEAFRGTLHDVRVWDRAISSEQISLSYQHVPGSSETGLIANWRMSGISGGTTVVDSVGGVNLSLANVAVGGGFTASTTTAGLSVNENATLGTRVGQVIATDPDIARDIVQDGLFREAAHPWSFLQYSAGQTFGNWTVRKGIVDLIGTYAQSTPLGGLSVDLDGAALGAIYQTLTTEIGKQYQVVFAMGGNFLGGEDVMDLRVTAAGETRDFSVTEPAGWSLSNMLFSNRSFTFTADSTSTTLDFQTMDNIASHFSVMIGDVRVIEIPQAVQAVLSNDSTLTYDAATGKFYRLVSTITQPLTAISAATSATLNGVNGQLATVRSAYENDLMWAYARQVGGDVLLGGRDATSEGNWRFLNGATESEQFSMGSTAQAGYYTNWRASEPNGSTSENQLAIRTDGQWQDVPDNQSRAYVIEWDASEVLSNYTYTITSDPLGAFAINSTTGEVTVSNAAPLNELSADPTIIVQVTDAAGNTYSEVLTVVVTRVNDNTPIITSNGGGATASINVAENSTVVTTITATDADLPAPTLTYSIVGGVDSALFSISSSTGALSFISGRNFENPADVGANNVYNVTIRVDDGTFWDDQAIAVTITNVNEAPTDVYAVPLVTEANVVGYYSFASANNLGRDDAGGTSPITFSGTVGQVTGPSGSGALDLSGGAHGNIASMTTGGAMTIATWVRFDTLSGAGWDRVFDFGQSNSSGMGNIYLGRFGTSNDLTFTIEKNGVYTYRATIANAITTGSWMHVAGTVDASGNMTLYVNGVALATATGVAPDLGIRTNHYIGRSNWPDGAFDGAVDDLLIANGAMSADSVSRLYQQTIGFTVAENSSNVTLIGTLLTSDPDASNTYTYALTNNAGGRFAIDTSTGQITVANGSLLDFETAVSHSVTVRVTDQGGLTYDEMVTVNLSNVNEAPIIASLDGDTRAYTEGDAAVLIGSTTGIADVDSTDFSSGALTISFTSGSDLAEDVLGIYNAGTGTGQIGVSGANVTFEGVTIGTWSGGSGGNNLVITLNANANASNTNALVNNLSYLNTDNDTPTTTTRYIRVVLSDGDGGTSVNNDTTMTVAAVNDSATIANLAGDRYDYTAGAGAVVIEQGNNAIVADVDSANFDTGSLTVSIASGGSMSEDRLAVRNQGTGAGQIGVSGSNITFGGVVIGTVAGGTSGADLVVSLNSNATSAAISSLVKNITFQNTNGSSPVTGSREISFTLNDGDGGIGLGYDATVNIAGANTATILDRFSNTTYSNNDGTQNWSTSWTELGESNGPTSGFVEADSTTNALEIGSGSTLLLFSTDITGLGARRTADLSTAMSASVSVDVWKAGVSSNGSLTLAVSTNGTTWTNLNTFNFSSLSTSRTTFTYDISAYISSTTSIRLLGAGSVGGFLASGYLYADNIGINYVYNTAPVLSLPGTQVNYTENDTATVIDATASLTDLESPNFSGGQLTVDFTSGGAAEDRLAIRNQGTGAGLVGVSGSNVTFGGVTIGTFAGGTNGSSPLVVSFNMNASTSAVQAVARNVTYFNVSDDPSTTSRQVRFGVTDGDGGTSSLVSESIVVSRLNDAPILDNTSAMTLNSITEDQTTNNGQTVASVILSAGGDRITDVDSSASEGIAITSLSSGNGTWEYSTNGGTIWTAVGSVSGTSSLLLRSTDLVRFIPNGQNATTANFAFRAWDETSGTFGNKVDTTANGGTTAFSTAIETASIMVTDVNDNIGAISDTNATANIVAEDATIGTTVGVTAIAIDVDSGDTVTYSLDYNAGGRYAINSSTGVVTVAGALNAENQYYETILVRATSSGGGAVVQGFNITVTSVNEAPTDIRIPITAASENFESGATGWSNTQTVDGGGTLTNYLGGWGNEIGATQVFKDYVLSGSQSSVTITFDMYELDSWYGEAFKVWVDGVEYSSHTLWMDAYSTFYLGREDEIAITQQMTDGTSSLGGGVYDDEIHRYTFTINTTATNVRLGFSSTLDGDASGESWGVDNLSIVENRPALSVAENSANTTVVGSVQGYDVDAGTTLTYSLTDSAGGRFVINSSTGQITVADGSLLNFEAATSHGVTVQISDGSLTYSEALTINVTNVNEMPTAVVDTATAVEAGGTANGTAGTNPTGNVLTNDTDIDAGDTKAVNGVVAGTSASASGSVGAAVTGTYGSINIAADGTYTYTVDNNNSAVQALRTTSNTLTDVYTYTMRDAAGLTSTTQITVTIQGANDAPNDLALASPNSTNLVTNGSFETNNGAANNFTAGVGVTVNGWTAIGGEGLEVWNNFNSGGPTSASDGISRLELDVVGALNGISQNIATTANQTYVVSFDFSNRNPAASSGIELYWRSTLIGTITQSTVGWQTYSFVVTGSGGSDELRFMETSATNDNIGSLLDNVRVMTESSPAIAIAENSANDTVVARAGSADRDTVSADTVTYSLTNSASGRFAINSLTGVITVADGTQLNFEAATSHVITIRATDTLGLTYDENFTINVSNVNEAVTAVSDTAIAVEAGGTANGTAGTNPTGNVLTNDTDIDAGDTKTVSGVVAGTSACASGSIGAAVTGTYGSINIAADGTYTYTVNDSNSAVQALRTTSNTLTDVYTYTMRDAAGLTSTTQITVTIQGANDAPTLTGSGLTTLFTEGFENPNITGLSSTDPTGWTTGTNPAYISIFDEDSGVFSTPFGSQALQIYSYNVAHLEFSTTAAILNSTLQAGTTYDLSFNVAHENTSAFGDYTVELLAIAGDNSVTVLGSVTGIAYMTDFSEANRIVFATADNHSTNLGERLAIRLSDNNVGTFNEVPLFDNIQLTAAQNQYRVDENSVNGTVVGSVAIDDVDAGDSATYALTNDAGGRFAIDSNTGIVTVSNGTLLNFEAATSHMITVRVTDVSGATIDQVLTVTVSDLNEAPVLDNTGTMTLTSISEDATTNGGQTVASIIASAGGDRITDGDTSPIEGIAISATTNGTGTWQYSLNGGSSWTNVGSVSTTSALLLRDTDLVRFVPNGQNGTTGNITFAAWDQTGGSVGSKVNITGTGGTTPFSTASEVASITVTSVNDAPTITDGATYNYSSIDEDSASTTATTSAILSTSGWADIDSGAVRGMAITGVTGSGSWQYSLNGTTWNTFGTVSGTSALLLNQGTVIRFQGDGSNGETATFTYKAWDQTAGTASTLATRSYGDASANGGTTAYSTSSATGQIVVTSVNDAPVLDSSYSTTLTTITEDLSGNAGQTVASMLASSGQDIVADVDSGAVEGIAVTATTNGNGSWEYSTNSGISWNSVGTVSENSALLLRSNDLIRFVPNGLDTTNGDITFRAWDQTGATIGAEGTKVDVSLNGGTTPFSSNSEIASITVTAVNDTPTAVTDTATAVEAGGIANGTAGTNPTGNVLTNDTDVDAGDTKTVSGVVAGTSPSASGSVGAAVTGTFGSINIAADGTYTYTVNNSNSAVQALRTTSNTLTDVYTYTMQDAGGLISTTQITVTIQGANDTPHDMDTTGLTIAENAVNTSSVGTITRSDLDSNDAPAYTLVDSAGGRFAIDVNTGAVTVANSSLLDYEVAATHSITVRVTDLAGAYYDEVFSVNLTDANEFAVTAPTDVNAAANAIDENVTIGTVVEVQALAADADATTNTVTYSLFDNDGGNFAIDANTGVVTTAAAINRESLGASRNITVRATSTDGSTADTVFTININDLDEFDVGAVADGNNASNEINENTVNGAVVGVQALAADADATTNTITYSLDDNAGGRFAINSSTGVVTVLDGSLLDFETTTSHAIVVRATSADTSFSTQSYTINLTDVNEGVVSAISDTDGATDTVLENATIGTVVGITANATDPDGTDTVSYSLDDDAGGRFTIHATTGVVTVAGAIDREAAASYNITIRATSSDTSFSTSTRTIAIGDVDEFNVGVVTDSNATVNSVVENATVGTVVGVTGLASDADATTNSITYTFTDNDGGRFAIDPTTGVVTVAGGIDRELDGATRMITVRATSADSSYSEEIFSISIEDANEFNVTASTDINATVNAIDESVSIGTLVGITASASDSDSTTNTIIYSLFDNDGGNFAIDTSTGVVTTAAAINRESLGASRNVTVRATSVDGSTADTVFTININDLDEFDVGVVTDGNNASNEIHENTVNGTVVGVQALAADADATTNTITYSLDDNAGGRFAIDSSTGVVTVLDGSLLDYEAAMSHGIVIRATSADTSFSIQNYTINLTDINEGVVSAISDADGATDTVLENATIGTVVGITANATDPDGTDTVSYSLDDDAGGRFTIHATTGVVTVAGAIDREAAASYNITIRATSSDSSTSTSTNTISIGDVDEYDVGVMSDLDGNMNLIAEHSPTGTVVGITASAFDLDATNNILSYTLTNSAGGRFRFDSVTGLVTVADGSLLNFEASSSHVVSVQAASSDGSLSTRDFTISLSDINERPFGTDDSYSVVYIDTLATSSTTGLLANDSDPDGNLLTAYLISGPSIGSFTLRIDGGFTYVPTAGFTGTVTFVYGVTDGTLQSDNITGSIFVSMPLGVPGGGSFSGSGLISSSSSSSGSSSSNSSTSNSTDSEASSDTVASQVDGAMAGEQTASDSKEVFNGDSSENATLPLSSGQYTEAAFSESKDVKEVALTETINVSITRGIITRYSSGSRESSFQDFNDSNGRRSIQRNNANDLRELSTAGYRMETEGAKQGFFTTDSVVNTVLGTGMVIWIIQGAQILAAVLSTAPAMIQLDPLSVLPGVGAEDEEEEPESDIAGKLFDERKI